MNKVGILTYHNNKNRGAILQAYCLWYCMNENLPNSEVEIIDYRILQKELKRILTINLSNPYIPIKNKFDFFRFIKRLRDSSVPIEFFREFAQLSKHKVITNNYNKAIEFLEKQDYDMIVVGSDQVWSSIKSSLRSFPNAYFLDSSLKCLKVSYAASANGVVLNSLSESEIKTFKKNILSFDKVSVRDEHTEDLLKELAASNIKRVPDPTILFNFPKNNLKDLLTSKGVFFDKPILGINMLKGNLKETIPKYYRKKGYQIVSPNISRYADVNLFGEVTPFEYYSLHKYFDFVISGSLHTSIFSIKNGTPFATLDFSSSDLIDKKETLLGEFSLLDRHIKVNEENTETIFNKLEECEKELGKKHILKRLSSMKQEGLKYIIELGEMLDEKEV